MSIKLFPGSFSTQSPVTAKQVASGLDVTDPDGTTPAVRFRGNTDTQYSSVYVSNATDFYVDHQVDSASVHIRGYDSGSAIHTMADLDPEGAVDLYYNDTKRLSTVNGGAEVSGTLLQLDSGADASTFQRILTSVGGLEFVVTVTGAEGRIRQVTSSGVFEDNWITMARNGAVTLYHNNAAKLATTVDGVAINNTTSEISAGSGTPESAVTAPVGSIYLRTDGGAGTSFYVKESGSGNTGWIAK